MGFTIVSYGAGTNSVAMLVGLQERGEYPAAIVFADTGSEKPHTYEHIEVMQKWCVANGFPPIVILGDEFRLPQQRKDGSLHAECLRLGSLPSKALGMGTCSLKWKIEPQRRWLRKILASNPQIIQTVRLIGFDADERARMDRATKCDPETGAVNRYPLIEWGWGREECLEAIKRAGLPLPGKSACWMCPSSKKPEILELRVRYPELLGKALLMERQAINGEKRAEALRTTKGLGRTFSWREFIDGQPVEDFGAPEIDCGCYDG